MRQTDSGGFGRRAFLKGGALVLATAALDVTGFHELFAREDATPDGLRIGLLTDLHYADKPRAGSRYYRETPGKLAEAAERFGREDLQFVVELGDLIDSADSVATEQGYLKRINREFSAISPNRHYVLGNHCVSTLTKEEFLDGVGQKRSYDSFDHGQFHFIVLDSCFRSDGTPYGRRNFEWTDANIPAAEVDWLRDDLKATANPVIVFAHQRLDVSNSHGVKNGPEVRRVLEASGKVLAVFQGHSHKNDYKEIAGIHYCTLVAMIEGSGAENNGYSVMEVRPDGTIRIQGFRKQADYLWPTGRKPSL
ncbi:alkaline phosphatase [Singulisphaera sp. GP187]|uniref:metallophosphoesterase n=1 Tax=Singulisphaera sp. GP187 TaxID=1882752 RepID=UPI00092CD068|nr:metallophosphoesterase [Singulisphaera sp. GP187]SIO61422.1 alkaline phosphatase [Singulisphaera sp. GP187]